MAQNLTVSIGSGSGRRVWSNPFKAQSAAPQLCPSAGSFSTGSSIAPAQALSRSSRPADDEQQSCQGLSSSNIMRLARDEPLLLTVGFPRVECPFGGYAAFASELEQQIRLASFLQPGIRSDDWVKLARGYALSPSSGLVGVVLGHTAALDRTVRQPDLDEMPAELAADIERWDHFVQLTSIFSRQTADAFWQHRLHLKEMWMGGIPLKAIHAYHILVASIRLSQPIRRASWWCPDHVILDYLVFPVIVTMVSDDNCDSTPDLEWDPNVARGSATSMSYCDEFNDFDDCGMYPCRYRHRCAYCDCSGHPLLACETFKLQADIDDGTDVDMG